MNRFIAFTSFLFLLVPILNSGAQPTPNLVFQKSSCGDEPDTSILSCRDSGGADEVCPVESPCQYVSCEQVREMSGGSAPNGEYNLCPDGSTSIRAYCDFTGGKGWTVINPAMNCRWGSLFSVWEKFAEGLVRGIGDSFSSWRDWFLIADNTTDFALSPNCREISTVNQVYRMSGNFYGCFWYNQNCNFNGVCHLCNNDIDVLTQGTCPWIGDGVGGFGGGYDPDFSYPFSCSLDWWNTAPSIGRLGDHCVAYSRPEPLKITTPTQLSAGELTSFEVTFNGVPVSTEEITWHSGDPRQLSVGTNGTETLLYGGDPGVSILIGEYQGQIGMAPIETHWLEIDGEYEITPGESQQLSAHFDGFEIDPTLVSWQSMTPAIGSVNTTGTVSALAVGEIIINATFEGHSASITVSSVPFRLSGKNELEIDEVVDVAPILLGQPVDPSEVTLTCEDPTIVLCNSDGTVEGEDEGITEISASHAAGISKKKVSVACASKKEQVRRIAAKILAHYVFYDCTILVPGDKSGPFFRTFRKHVAEDFLYETEQEVYNHILGKINNLFVSSEIPKIILEYEKRLFQKSHMHGGIHLKEKNPSITKLRSEFHKTVKTDIRKQDDPPGEPHHRYPAAAIQDKDKHWYWLKAVETDHIIIWDPCKNVEIQYNYNTRDGKYYDSQGKSRDFVNVVGAWMFPVDVEQR